jgi:hypothetical protein
MIWAWNGKKGDRRIRVFGDVLLQGVRDYIVLFSQDQMYRIFAFPLSLTLCCTAHVDRQQ